MTFLIIALGFFTGVLLSLILAIVLGSWAIRVAVGRGLNL